MAITAQITLNEILIIEVDSDPSVGGVTAPIGSMALLDDKVNGKIWIKSGGGDTAWSIIPRFANGTSFTSGSVVFADSSGFFAQNNPQLFWDNSNSRLGLGVNSPQAKFHQDAGTATAHAIKLTVGGTTGVTTSDGFDIGVTATGAAEIRQRENSNLTILTNNQVCGTFTAAGSFISGSSSNPNWRIVNGDVDQVSPFLVDAGNGVTANGVSYTFGPLGLGLLKANGSNRIVHVGFQLINSSNTVGSETSDLSILTKPSSGFPLERLRITGNGTVIIGSANEVDVTGAGAIPTFQIVGTAATQMAAIQYSNDSIPPVFNLLKSRGALNAQGLLQSNDELGRLQFRGSDGVNFQAGASVRAAVDGTASAGSMPGRLIFLTTPSGSTTPLERMRISQDGSILAYNMLIASAALNLGNTANATTGNVRWNGTDFEGYNGTNWYSLTTGLRRKYTQFMTAIQASTSTTYTSVTELTTVTLPVGRYTFRFSGLFQSTNTNTGIGVRVSNVTAIVGYCFANWLINQGNNGTAANYQYDQTSTATNVSSASVSSSNSDNCVSGQGSFQITTAGTMSIQLRSETGTAVSLRPGCTFTIEEVL